MFAIPSLKFLQPPIVNADDEDALLRLLKEIFAAKKTRRVIAAILGQSTGDVVSV